MEVTKVLNSYSYCNSNLIIEGTPMAQSNNGTDVPSSHKEPLLDGDKRQGEKRPRISILAIIAFVVSILVTVLLGIVLHRIRTDPGLDLVLLQNRKFYEFWENLCVFQFGPAAIVLSVLSISIIWLNRIKVGGLRLAVASFVISVAGYILFWLIWLLPGTW
jgi:hypothetical protein